MELKWLGHACFSITHRGYTVVIDPYNSDYTTGYPKLKVKADKVLVSHESYGHNYRQGVTLSGKSESACPFTITSFEAAHDHVNGRMRGMSRVHILQADGLKIAHMGDLGEALHGEQITQLFGADAVLIDGGSCTALPAQDNWRVLEEIMPRVIIPMHYRFPGHGTRRQESLEAFLDYAPSPELIHYYATDTLELTQDNEPQVAVLKFMG